MGSNPAPAALQRALKRAIISISGIGEQLPLKSKTADTLFMQFTLSFLVDPQQVLNECRRVLKKDGRLVMGHFPALSAWGQLLETKNNRQPLLQTCSFLYYCRHSENA